MNMQLTEEQAIELNLHCRKHPEFFVSEILGANPWEKQIEIVRAVFKNRNVAVKTCNSVGKSYIAARIVVTYLMLYPDSIVVTTAPTWRQVTDVLWREIASTVKQAEQIKGIKLTNKDVNQAGLNLDTKWYAVGVSTSHPDNMMGYHADNLLVVVDEAGGVDDLIYRGVKAITTNVNNKVLLIGNPTATGGTFWNAFEKNSLYRQFTISAFDTPNMIANGIRTTDDLKRTFQPPPDVDQIDYFNQVTESLIMPYPELISPGTVWERYLEWGEDSNAWESLILGEFPTESDQALIPTNLVNMAMHNDGIDETTGKTFAEIDGWNIPDGPPRFGLDMARFGSDSTVLTPRQGGKVEPQIVWNKTDLLTSADKVVNYIDAIGPASIIHIDDTGNGGGTTDALGRLKSTRGDEQPYTYTVRPWNFSSKEYMSDSDRSKYHDVTSMLYWNLRSWFMNKQISIPYEKQLYNELVSRRWHLDPAGRIVVESKDDYKKRTPGNKSPDRSDSLALAFASEKSLNTLQQRPLDDLFEENEKRYAPVTGRLSRRY